MSFFAKQRLSTSNWFWLDRLAAHIENIGYNCSDAPWRGERDCACSIKPMPTKKYDFDDESLTCNYEDKLFCYCCALDIVLDQGLRIWSHFTPEHANNWLDLKAEIPDWHRGKCDGCAMPLIEANKKALPPNETMVLFHEKKHSALDFSKSSECFAMANLFYSLHVHSLTLTYEDWHLMSDLLAYVCYELKFKAEGVI